MVNTVTLLLRLGHAVEVFVIVHPITELAVTADGVLIGQCLADRILAVVLKVLCGEIDRGRVGDVGGNGDHGEWGSDVSIIFPPSYYCKSI